MRDDPSELLDLAEWYRELAHVGRDHHRRDRTYRWQSTWKAGPGAGSAKAARVDRDTRRKRAQLRLRRNGAGGRTDRVYRQVGMPLRSASGWVAEGLGPCPGYLLSMTMKVFAIS